MVGLESERAPVAGQCLFHPALFAQCIAQVVVCVGVVWLVSQCPLDRGLGVGESALLQEQEAQIEVCLRRVRFMSQRPLE